MDATGAVPGWITLLIQVPLVGVFVWYSLEINKRAADSQKRYEDALDRRDQAYESRNRALIETMERNNEAIVKAVSVLSNNFCEHDKSVREYIATQSARRKSSG